MITAKDIYIMIRQECCFGTCDKWKGITYKMPKPVCCRMHAIAEVMIIGGGY